MVDKSTGAHLKRAPLPVVTVFFMVYIFVAGGSFGIEDMVSSSGPGLTLLMLLVLPVFWSLPMALIASVVALSSLKLQPIGIVLALTSGIVTSGLGYVLWYQALRSLTTTQASVVQLLVPVIAAFGGVLVLSEVVTPRLIGASVLILGGVAMAVVRRKASTR